MSVKGKWVCHEVESPSALLFWGSLGGSVLSMALAYAMCLLWGVSDGQPPAEALAPFVSDPSIFLRKAMTMSLWGAAVAGLWGSVALIQWKIAPKMGLSAAGSPSAKLASAIAALAAVAATLFFARDASVKAWGVITTSTLPVVAPLMAPANPALLGALIVAMCACALARSSSDWIGKDAARSMEWALAGLALGAAVFYAARLSLVDLPGLIGLSAETDHEVPLSFPIFLAGRGKFVYLDAWSQYGGFAQVASWMPERLADEKLAMAMAWALGLGLVFLFDAVRRASESALLGLMAMMASLWLSGAGVRMYLAYQGANLRWLFPCAMMWAATLPPKRSLMLGGALAPCAVFWNPETGLACSAAWALYIGWRCAMGAGKNKGHVFRDAWISLAACAAAALAIAAGFRWSAGEWPQAGKALLSMKLFGAAGFMGLPTSPVHWWWLALLASALSLASACALFESDPKRASFLAFAAALQCFLMPYYLGRSAYGNFLAIAFPSVAMAAVLISSSWQWSLGARPQSWARRVRRASAWAGVAALALCSGALAVHRLNGPQARTPASDEARRSEQAKVSEFVRSTAKDKSLATVAFVAPQAAAIMELAGAPADRLPQTPLSGTILVEQARQWERWVGSSNEIYWDPSFSIHPGGPGAYPWRERIDKMLREDFIVVDEMPTVRKFHPLLHLERKGKPERIGGGAALERLVD